MKTSRNTPRAFHSYAWLQGQWITRPALCVMQHNLYSGQLMMTLMAKGTRCNQLAEYIVFYAPLQMLSDNPTTYMKEQECTDFITKVPTTFDETDAA